MHCYHKQSLAQVCFTAFTLRKTGVDFLAYFNGSTSIAFDVDAKAGPAVEVFRMFFILVISRVSGPSR